MWIWRMSKKNCFYKNYCKMIIPKPFIYTIDGKEIEKDEFINYVIFKLKEGEENVWSNLFNGRNHS